MPRPATRYTARKRGDIPDSLRHVLARIYRDVAEGEPEGMNVTKETGAHAAAIVQFHSTSESSAASKMRLASRILRDEGVAFVARNPLAGRPRGTIRIELAQYIGHDDDTDELSQLYEDATIYAARAIERAGKRGVSSAKLSEALERIDPDNDVSDGALAMALRELGFVQDPATRTWYELRHAPRILRELHSR